MLKTRFVAVHAVLLAGVIQPGIQAVLELALRRQRVASLDQRVVIDEQRAIGPGELNVHLLVAAVALVGAVPCACRDVIDAAWRRLDAWAPLRRTGQGQAQLIEWMPVAREALYQLIETFFGGRPEQVVNTLLTDEQRKLSEEDLDRLSAMIAEARRRGKE